MEWVLAVFVLAFVAAFVWRQASRPAPEVPGRPKGCSCLWFMNDEGTPYRALADTNCRHHEGN